MHAMRAWPLRTAIVVAGTFCVSGCGPIYAGPLAVANEGGHVVVLAPICHGRLTDILVDVERGDAEHPQVWHHGAISHDLSVDLMAPADGWTGPTLVLSPGTTYTVSGGEVTVPTSETRPRIPRTSPCPSPPAPSPPRIRPRP